MKQLILIFSFFCCITSASLCENYYGTFIEPINALLKEDTKSVYIISTSNESITISYLTIGSHVWVFDSSGRNIYNKVTKNSLINVPIRSKGIYIIRVKTGKDISTVKVLIK